MSTSAAATEQERIDSEASAWLVRVEDGRLSFEARKEFEAWRAADHRHAGTYNEMARTWAEIPELSDLADLVPAPVLAGVAPVPRRRWPLVAGSLAGVAAVLLAIWGVHASLFDGGERYHTQIAEMRIVTLPDGSSVTLGAKSAIAVRYTDTERRIELSGGEAFFDVFHNARRPFVVAAGGSLIRDIGTKFDVNLSTGTVRVSVLEGKVAVSRTGPSPIRERLIVAGQRTEVPLVSPSVPQASGVLVAPVLVPLPAQAPGAWREGRLTYDNVRLADIVSDVNRYYAPGIELTSPDVGGLRVTASFKTNEIPAFMSALSATLPVRADAQQGGRFKVSEAR